MKKVTLILSIALAFTLVACNNSEPSSATETAPQQTESTTPDIQVNGLENTNTPQQAPAAAASANGEKHYICPNGCEGSGGAAAGTCPQCGASYVHNAAFHAQQSANTLSTQPGSPQSIMTTPQAQTPEPAQNANGVWHYTCPNGCEGGGGSAAPCPNCGATLAHNTAYHQ